MANSDTLFGARLIGHLSGSPINAQIRRYSVPASDGTALFVGDFVKSNGTADTDGTPQVIQAAAGNTVRGVVVGFEPLATNLNLTYRTASTQRYVLVCDDPHALFEIQEDSVGGDLAATAVGGNADITVGSGSTTSGLSGMELDSSTAATTAATLRIHGLVQRADNEIGTNAKWIVQIVEHELITSTGV